MMKMSGRRGGEWWDDVGDGGMRGWNIMEMSGRRIGEWWDDGDEWEERRRRVG
jgi:hypothetical protein